MNQVHCILVRTNVANEDMGIEGIVFFARQVFTVFTIFFSGRQPLVKRLPSEVADGLSEAVVLVVEYSAERALIRSSGVSARISTSTPKSGLTLAVNDVNELRYFNLASSGVSAERH